MVRDIKFRAWDEKGKRWLHGYSPGGLGCSVYGETMICGGWLSEVGLEGLNDVTVEQYTGLMDKNGVEIYEGDVIRGQHHDYGPGGFHKATATVGFDIQRGYRWNYWQLSTLEVIGNIHEHRPSDAVVV